jgi:hypothetical protein
MIELIFYPIPTATTNFLSIRADLPGKSYTIKMEVDTLSELDKIRLTSLSTKAG